MDTIHGSLERTLADRELRCTCEKEANFSFYLCNFSTYSVTQSEWHVSSIMVKPLSSQIHIKIYQGLKYIYIP